MYTQSGIMQQGLIAVKKEDYPVTAWAAIILKLFR